MSQEKYDIFISYRRKDENGKAWGTSIARNIEQALESRGYEGRVFFDHIKIGAEDFEKKILGAIKQAKIFLCVLTKNAMDNCVNEDDWVRREICQAIESGLTIIFLNPDNEFNHKLLPNNFPKELGIVKKQNSLEIRTGEKFENDMNDMVDKYISPVVRPRFVVQRNPLMIDENYATVRIDNDLDCKVFSYGKFMGVAKVGEYTSFSLFPGDNVLKFVSVDGEKESFTKNLKLEKNCTTRIEVKLLDKYNARKNEERKQYLLSHPDDDFRSCFCAKGERGYKIKSTGEIVRLQKKYEKVARSFNEGVAWVQSEGKYGFVDKTGREVISTEYDDVDSFSGGLVRVSKNKRWGFIDLNGRIIIPLEYTYALSFCEGLAMVQLNSKCGYIDKTGEEVIPRKYSDAHSFHNGLAAVNIDDMWNYIDKSGKKIVSTSVQYTYVSVFCEGFARVNIGGKRYSGGKQGVEGGKWGFINEKGRGIIPVKYDKIEDFCKGLAKVARAGKLGYVNTEGKEVVACEYDNVEYLRDSVVLVEKAGKSGYIYTKCKNDKSAVYDKIDVFCEDLARVKLKGKWGCIDKSGSVVVPCKYFSIENFSNGKAKVKEKNIFGNIKEFYIDKNGNRIDE